MSEPESQPEFDPEARILAAMLDTGAREIQQITTHWEYTYLPCLPAEGSALGHRHHRRRAGLLH